MQPYTPGLGVSTTFSLVPGQNSPVSSIGILLGEEGDHLLNPLVGKQGFHRVVLALKLLVREQGVDHSVAIRTDQLLSLTPTTLRN